MKAVGNGNPDQTGAECGVLDEPDPDAVKVWLTEKIYTHYEERGAFPQLRYETRSSRDGCYNLHWCDQATAIAILNDAKEQLSVSKGWMRNALHAVIRSTEVEIDEARIRRKWLEGAVPKSVYISERHRKYVATRSQLGALEVPSDLALPGTEGGPVNKATYKNAAGMVCSVLRANRVWPGAYFVNIEVPKKPQAPEEDSELAELRRAPQTADKFIESRLELLAMSARTLRLAVDTSKPGLDSPGFDYSPETVARFRSEVVEALARLRDILRYGEVVGGGPQPMIAARQAELAKRDKRLQGFLRLVHSRPMEES